ncbi:OsmC family protein [Flammeovirga sp. SubArs3]|uniref:bifunctional alpha/beta hydrolase/OsmC family protein n=1 Tax=Flammeovirga sp. SubArs3 TaxID=2995316 RepID=UPI00248C11C5|nr:OsmC family protein [Flammeovirga sp. SubArs3]
MSSTIINFNNRSGESITAGLSLPADERPKAYAIFAHCFNLISHTAAVDSTVRALNQKGIAVFTLDFTGADTDFQYHAALEDLLDAAEYLEKNYRSPQMIIGHSLAGLASILVANRIASIEAVVTISAIAKAKSITKLVERKRKDLAEVTLGENTFGVKESLIDQLTFASVKEAIHKMKLPILVFHSPQDNIVDINNAEKIYKLSFHPKSFISLDGADHFLTNVDNAYYTGDMIGSWSARYVEMVKENPLVTQHQTAVRIGTTKYVTEVKAGIHHQIADEPIEDGGKDLGPNPYQFLLAGLGACTAMTLRMYANHKKWPLEEVTVHLNHENEYLKDANETNKRTAKLDKLERAIQVKGDLTDQQRERLLEIANKCPVHRTLENNPIITTKWVEE